MVRKEKYPVDFILKKVRGSKPRFIFLDGDKVNIGSSSLVMYKKRGVKCMGQCLLEGSYFYKEKYDEDKCYHLTLYAAWNGREIKMTKDHIIPLSEGGSNKIENLQPMCKHCNEKKMSSMKGIPLEIRIKKFGKETKDLNFYNNMLKKMEEEKITAKLYDSINKLKTKWPSDWRSYV